MMKHVPPAARPSVQFFLEGRGQFFIIIINNKKERKKKTGHFCMRKCFTRNFLRGVTVPWLRADVKTWETKFQFLL